MSGLRVLLVDDEVDFVETLAERLELRGFTPFVANTGEEALAMLDDAQPQVMVLDLKMPGMSGLVTLTKALAREPDLAVIMLTGHGSDLERDEALSLGAKEYLQKPVDLAALITLLESVSQ